MSAPATRQAPALAKRILLAEDSLVQRLSLTGVLEDQGYEVEAAQDGEEALRLLQNPRVAIDLVIADIGMPKMNGINLCRGIKKNTLTKHIPVLMLTSFVDDRNQRTALEAGAIDFVTKPVNEQELLLRVEAILSGTAVREESAKLNWHSELFEALPDAIIVADHAGRYIDVNPAASDLFGHSREELLQMSDQASALHAPGWWEGRRPRLGQEHTWLGLSHFRHKTGAIMAVDTHLRRTTFDGEPVYIAVLRKAR